MSSTALVSQRLSLTGNKRQPFWGFSNRGSTQGVQCRLAAFASPATVTRARARLGRVEAAFRPFGHVKMSFGLARRPAGLADGAKRTPAWGLGCGWL